MMNKYTEYDRVEQVSASDWKRWMGLTDIKDFKTDKKAVKALGAQPNDAIRIAGVDFPDNAHVDLWLKSDGVKYYLEAELVTPSGTILTGSPVQDDLDIRMEVKHEGVLYDIVFEIVPDQKGD